MQKKSRTSGVDEPESNRQRKAKGSCCTLSVGYKADLLGCLIPDELEW